MNILAVTSECSLSIEAVGIRKVDLAVMVLTGVLLLPMMRSGFLLNRWEGVCLLAIYGGYIFYLFLQI